MPLSLKKAAAGWHERLAVAGWLLLLCCLLAAAAMPRSWLLPSYCCLLLPLPARAADRCSPPTTCSPYAGEEASIAVVPPVVATTSLKGTADVS
eukprot:COSAG01_NODE_3004_length_6735_cov_44.599759_5_plen_94_part_00